MDQSMADDLSDRCRREAEYFERMAEHYAQLAAHCEQFADQWRHAAPDWHVAQGGHSSPDRFNFDQHYGQALHEARPTSNGHGGSQA